MNYITVCNKCSISISCDTEDELIQELNAHKDRSYHKINVLEQDLSVEKTLRERLERSK